MELFLAGVAMGFSCSHGLLESLVSLLEQHTEQVVVLC